VRRAAGPGCTAGSTTAFLDPDGVFQKPKRGKKFDCVIAADCASFERLGKVATAISRRSLFINIDHHASNTRYADLNWVSEREPSTGELVFRLLKIAHPREDFHGIHAATTSDDRRARANASEFIDTLLGRRDQQPLRELLRLVTDDLDGAERVRRAAPFLPRPAPHGRTEAVLALIEDPDLTVAAIANAHAVALGDDMFRQAVSEARRARPALKEQAARLFGLTTQSMEVVNAGG